MKSTYEVACQIFFAFFEVVMVIWASEIVSYYQDIYNSNF